MMILTFSDNIRHLLVSITFVLTTIVAAQIREKDKFVIGDPLCLKNKMDRKKISLEFAEKELSLKNMAPPFEHFEFRANNYGTSTYLLKPQTMPPLLSIEMVDGGRKDTMRGGGLGNVYDLHNVILSLNNSSKKDNINIWMLYIQQEVITEADLEFVALKMDFKEKTIGLPGLNPIIKALRELIETQQSYTTLSHTYDPYGILPLDSGYTIYYTTSLPFLSLNKRTINNSPCGPIIKVYSFTKDLPISREQLSEIYRHSNVLFGNLESKYFNEIIIDEPELAIISFSKPQEHSIKRRMVAVVHSHPKELPEDEEEDEEDEEQILLKPEVVDETMKQNPIVPKDEALFPKGCEVLMDAMVEFEEKASQLKAVINKRDSTLKSNGCQTYIASKMLITLFSGVSLYAWLNVNNYL